MKYIKKETVNLGRSGEVALHVAEDGTRLLIEFKTDPLGLTKAGVNGLIDALKAIRKEMKR
jgi:hypothetical protein